MGAYLPDEVDHTALRLQLLEGEDPVISSVVARLEFASAAHAAARAQRLSDPAALLARFDADCLPGGALSLLVLRPEAVFAAAYRILAEHPVRTLDAIHLAVAIEDGGRLAGDDELAFVTRDRVQAEAARALGLSVA